MDRRIYGIETEFGLTHSAPQGRALSADDAARRLFAPVLAWGRASNVFLPNGGRLYLDVGSHPEYATAEAATLHDVVAQDAAGERIVDDLRAQLQRTLDEEGVGGTVHLFKNNVDSAGNSFGSHENYMISRRTEFARLVQHLLPFLVTRQILVGAGRVHPTGQPPFGALTPGDGSPSYSFSQRADHIWEGSSSATTRSRPMINTRDEPHADAQHYRRLHVITGDSSMSQTTTALKIGTTDLLLRMIEAGQILPDRTLADPATALRVVSHDLTGTAALELANGERRSALELQHEYLDAVTRFVARHGAHHDRVDRVLDLWERGLRAVAEQDASLVDRELDWAIKKKLLDSYAASHDMDYSHPRMVQLDLAYHDTSATHGLFHMLERRGAVESFVSPEDVSRALVEAPGTRASLRGRFVAAAHDAGVNHTVDWVHLKLNGEHQQRTIMCKDPFATTQQDVEDVIRDITRGDV
ncbi:Pup--protein ligase [Kocuria tytonis]|uniref:Pup--protein ligase n=1 Tax=Kocuria tytonis TaxID=2054280 RepID=A0A495A8N7_9MICC|nr:Pup--protein ligase [Kocuria tytonis]RKQ36318.1 Pup--protein ligase [Kocuria tytonis]